MRLPPAAPVRRPKGWANSRVMPNNIAMRDDNENTAKCVRPGLGGVLRRLEPGLVQPTLPLFYSNVLGLPKEVIGLIGGVLNTTIALTKVAAGWLRWRNRT